MFFGEFRKKGLFFLVSSVTTVYAFSYKTQTPVLSYSRGSRIPGPIRFHGSREPLGADFCVYLELVRKRNLNFRQNINRTHGPICKTVLYVQKQYIDFVLLFFSGYSYIIYLNRWILFVFYLFIIFCN